MSYDPTLHQERVKHCYLLATLADGELLGDTLDEMLNAMSSMDAIAPVLDPTLWINKSDAMHEDKEIVEAVRNLRNVYRKLKGKHEKAK